MRKFILSFLLSTSSFISFLSFLLIGFVLDASCEESGIGKCSGKFVNPITDICWKCVFPITISGIPVYSKGEDTPNPKKLFCFCQKGVIPQIGLPVTFWEPIRMIDITRTKFCLVGLGGIKLGPDSVKGHGSISGNKMRRTVRTSFYQAHFYRYPVLFWLRILIDFLCLESESIELAYITEIDPLWNDDETAFIINPEAVLFGNPIAQAACGVDGIAATVGFPIDALFWCSGCQGSIYPFTGHVPYHVGAVQASLLLVSRMLAKMHREGLANVTIGEEALCARSVPGPFIVKSQYKQQMLYPVPTTGEKCCKPLGRTSVIWESGKEKPYVGEDFNYLIWRKRHCCLL